MEEIEFSQWLFEGRLRQGKNVLPDGLNWLCYFAGSSKSHRENSISFIFLESPHQVDMKNVVKSSKHFFGYFNTLETHSGVFEVPLLIFSFSFTDVGPVYKAPPPVATQLVVPTELSDGPVTLTCFHCQEHVTTRTKTGPSTLTWALCAVMCICV